MIYKLMEILMSANVRPFIKAGAIFFTGLVCMTVFLLSKFNALGGTGLQNPNLFLALGILLLISGTTSLSLRFAILKQSKRQ